MILLENQIGCLTPELSELKKQYESVSDLFNTKKSVLQDHFSKLLNGECNISLILFLGLLKCECSTMISKANLSLTWRWFAQTTFKEIIIS